MQDDVTAVDPIAVVGMACRFPGNIDSPESLWRFVIDGKHTSSKFPADRSMTELADIAAPEVVAAMAPMGGFIDEPGEFDPEFFGISPREAKAMDPQQRIVLELTWQALEDARIDPNALHGSDTGVYVGAMSGDYAYLIPGQKDLDPGYVATGVSQSVLSGRISYVLGLQGPTMSIDTACSSSLVAMHLAARALKAGECSLALAAGVSIMSTLTGFYALGQHGAISKEGRSKPYSADADGFCMSEGAAVLVLERLSDARRHGHQVFALLRGAAVNQDGATKGLTVPSAQAQRKVIEAALADAGLGPGDVDVVEGHGTGTPVGDPVELEALFATYGSARPAGSPVRLGSVKGNFGHTQAAAGLAGVIKMIEAMRHETVPPSLGVSEPTGAVDWSSGAVRVVTEASPWPAGARPRRAGVSSFGISGTNAHVIVEEPPRTSPAPSEPRRVAPPVLLWPVSAKTPAALAAQAAALAEHVTAHPGYADQDIAYSLTATRATFDHRAVAVGGNRAELLDALAAIAAGRPVGPIRGQAMADRGVVFVFPGQGGQYRGMAKQLIAESPEFAAGIRECDAAFAEFVDFSVFDVLTEAAGAPTLDHIDVLQPALFSTMVSLARLWRALGVAPAAVIGHSQGEVAAAYVAGALSLADAARVVALRSRALRTLAGTGTMASIGTSAARVRELLVEVPELDVAAVNSPTTTVVAGAPEAVERMLAVCEREGLRARRIHVEVASHTGAMETVAEEIRAALAPITPRPSAIEFFSTVTGDVLETENLGADYWFANLRQTVNFEDGFQAAFQSGYNAFLEMSATPVLTAAMHESLDQFGAFADSCLIVGTLEREDAGLRRFLTSVATAHVHGVSPRWSRLYDPATHTAVPLPTYPFQRQTYWLASVHNANGGKPSGLGLADPGHPLLGAMTELPGADRFQFSTRLAVATHGWLCDHALHGNVLVPGAMLLELALHAGDKVGCPGVEKLTMYTPVTLPEQGAVHLHLVVGEAKAPGRRSIAIYSRPENEDAPAGQNLWSLHADGTLTTRSYAEDADQHGVELWPPVGAQQALEPERAYQTLAALGYHYGPIFQGMRAVWRRGEDIFAEVALPESVADADKYGLHPALLDAAMQSVAAVASMMPTEPGAIRLPFAWERVQLHAIGAKALRAKLTPAGPDRVRWVLADHNGRPVAVGTLQVRSISMGALAQRGLSGRQDSLFGVDWPALPVQRTRWTARPGEWAVLGDLPPGLTAGAELTVYPDRAALSAALADGAPVPKVVLATRTAAGRRAESGPSESGPGATPPTEAVRAELAATLAWLQDWLADERVTETRLVLMSTGVQAVEPAETVTDLSGATVWGLVRSAQSEYQDRILQLDLDGAGVTLDQLATAVALDEPELALRRGTFHGRRIRSGLDAAATAGARLAGHWRLDIPGTGNLDDVTLVAGTAPAAELAPGTVRVALRAAGLSFPVALTGLAAVAGAPRRLVHEAAGVVRAVAADVTGFAPGDAVFGLVDAIADTVDADAALLAPVPAGWSMPQAAAAPVAYVTALHALREAAATTGERVLVHCATGGVGTAAVHLATHLGLEVFATASERKRDTLRGMGLAEDHLADSRSAEFATRFAGRGIDIVLDLLPAELTDASLGLLGATGRFVDLARGAVRDPRAVREACGVTYRTFELGDLDRDTLAGLLAEIARLAAAGTVPALPSTRFDIRQADAALRHLGEARHVGKIVLTWPPAFDPDRTVLVTGGTGTIGAIVARHLVHAYGARHLLLTSRSGPAAAGIDDLVAELTDAGARVRVAACDAADRAALAAVLDTVPAAHPLGGVVHLAAALADATFAQLTPDHLGAVLGAKADGAWHLHELTRDLDLSMFVLFSSAAGTFGAPGQANYAAANVFLDALARRRYHDGLAATSMAWGWWAEDTSNTGALDDKDRARLTRMGVTPIETEQALALFDAALHTGRPYLVPVGMDLSLLRVASSVAELPPFFRALLHSRPRATQQMGDSSQLAKRLAGLSPAEQHAVVVDMLETPIAMVLGYSSPEAVHPDREFTEMGIDSLSSIELGTHLRAITGVKLANSVIFQYPTVNLLAGHVLDQVTPQDAELADPIVSEVEMLLDRLAALHDDGQVPEPLLERLTGSIGRLRGGEVAVGDGARP